MGRGHRPGEQRRAPLTYTQNTMANLEEQLTSQVLRRAEIARLTRERDAAQRDGRENDAVAFEGVLQLFTDYDQGVVRCHECGRIKSRRRDD